MKNFKKLFYILPVILFGTSTYVHASSFRRVLNCNDVRASFLHTFTPNNPIDKVDLKEILVKNEVNTYKNAKMSKEVLKIRTLREVKSIVNDLLKKYEPSKMLTIFDIDKTLIQSREPFLQTRNLLKHADILKQHVQNANSPYENYILPIYALRSAQILIEEDAPAVIEEIKSYGVDCICCTHAVTGAFIDIPSVQHSRLQSLNSVGIKLSHTETDITFEELGVYRGYYPTLLGGILSTNRVPKSILVKSFLKRTNLNPDVIIFVDDDDKQVEEFYVEDSHNIALQYFGTYDYKSQELSVEEMRIVLEKTHDEIKEMLKDLKL